MVKYVGCPYCGSMHIEYDEMINDYYELSSYFAIWKGICSNCGKKLEWKEEYALERVFDMKVVEEGEQSSSLILY